MLRNRLYRSPGIDGIRLALVIIEAFTPMFYGRYKNKIKKIDTCVNGSNYNLEYRLE